MKRCPICHGFHEPYGPCCQDGGLRDPDLTDRVPTLDEKQLLAMVDGVVADELTVEQILDGDEGDLTLTRAVDEDTDVTRERAELTEPTTPEWASSTRREAAESTVVVDETRPDGPRGLARRPLREQGTDVDNIELLTAADDEVSDTGVDTGVDTDVGAEELTGDSGDPVFDLDLANELEGPSVVERIDAVAGVGGTQPLFGEELGAAPGHSLLVDSASPSPVSPVKRSASSKVALLPIEKREFGRYVLLCRFASGGMADLFLARVPGASAEELVAIKRIHEHLTAQPGFLEMFLDEGRLAGRIDHPNVVNVRELGRVGPSHFIAMEHVPGQSLRSVLRRRRLPYAVAARVVSQAALGLHAAHELRGDDGELLQVVHRDVSPGNILVAYDGKVKVTDFGVARARGNLHTTAVGMVKGKFAYMAPEQARAGTVDRRTDIFSLGVVLYEATTRRRLFRADSEQATLLKVLSDPIAPPSALDADYPSRLEQVVMRALERDPRLRFQTALEAHQALEGYLAQCGEQAAPRALATIMHEVFSDQIAEQQAIVARSVEQVAEPLAGGGFADNPSVSDLHTGPGAPQIPTTEPPDPPSITSRSLASRSLEVAAVAPTRARVNRRWLIGGLLGLGFVVALVGSLSLMRCGGGGEAPAKVWITIRATPTSARIVIDGQPVNNPFELIQPPSDRVAKVVISAPEHITRRVELPLSRGTQLNVALDRQPSVALDAGVAAALADASRKLRADTRPKRQRPEHRRAVGRRRDAGKPPVRADGGAADRPDLADKAKPERRSGSRRKARRRALQKKKKLFSNPYEQ